MEKDQKSLAIASALYLIICAIIFFPILGQIDSHIPAFDFSPPYDAHFFLWLFWWFNHSIFELGSNPLYSSQILYPHGAGLFMSTSTPLMAFAGSILQFFFSIPASYTLVILASFPLSGIFAYLLCRHFTGNAYASFLGGLAYMLTPYHFAHLVQANLVSIQWFPLFFLFFFKARGDPSKKNQALLSLAFGLLLYTSEMYALFSLLFIAVFFLLSELGSSGGVSGVFISFRALGLFAIKIFSKSTKLAKAYPLALFLFISLSLPYGIPNLAEFVSQDYGMPYFLGLFYRLNFHAQPLTYLLPSPQSAALGFFRSLYAGDSPFFMGNIQETNVSLGLTFLAISLWGIIKSKKEQLFHTLALTAGFFIILSFGPVIMFLNLPILLNPLDAINLFPPFSVLRVSSRYAIIAITILLIFFAKGMAEILSGHKRKNIIAGAVFLILLFEFYPAAFTTLDVRPNPYYFSIQNSTAQMVILDLPINKNMTPVPGHFQLFTPVSSLSQYYQTAHGKPILAGALSRYPTSSVSDLESDWLIRANDLDFSAPQETRADFLSSYATHVVFHKNFINETERNALSEFEKTGFKKEYEDSELAVYSIRN